MVGKELRQWCIFFFNALLFQFSFGSDGGDGVQLVFFFFFPFIYSLFFIKDYLKHLLGLVKSFLDFFPIALLFLFQLQTI